MVLVKKSNGKWRMCIDFTDLNNTCLKDSYQLPNIDTLEDGRSRYRVLSFIDAYLGYNQIKMHPLDARRTGIMTDTANYYNLVMPFGLKYVRVAYLAMLTLRGIRRPPWHKYNSIEVYMDDMLMKSEEIPHHEDLLKIFQVMTMYEIRLNLEECSFGVLSVENS